MINIQLNNIYDALNKFNNELLSDELDEYILNSCSSKAISNKSITLTINGIKSKKNQEIISDVIHNYYKNKVKYYKKIDKIDDYFRVTLLALGIFIFLICENLTFFMSEVLLIIGWIMIWEFGYDILFNGLRRRKKAQTYKLLSKCFIEYT